jgi:glucose/arabinose dehydrogenase
VVATLLAGVAGSATAAESSFRRTVFASGFDSPVQVVSTKSEPRRLYVVEQRGTIRVIERGRTRAGFVLDLRGRVSRGNEQGLLGLAFDPKYASNRLLYVNYTDLAGDTRVVRYRTKGLRVLPSTRRELLGVDQPYANHNGGNLVFGPDGFLYVGLGDGGSGGDPQGNAQNPSALLGKMLRLDVRRPGSRPEIVALGLRNPWRYSFDRATGDLYIGDVGQNAVEEVDYTPASSPGLENYGWNLYEGSRGATRRRVGAGELIVSGVRVLPGRRWLLGRGRLRLSRSCAPR